MCRMDRQRQAERVGPQSTLIRYEWLVAPSGKCGPKKVSRGLCAVFLRHSPGQEAVARLGHQLPASRTQASGLKEVSSKLWRHTFVQTRSGRAAATMLRACNTATLKPRLRSTTSAYQAIACISDLVTVGADERSNTKILSSLGDSHWSTPDPKC
jgi:hypothetical protein